MDHPAIHFTTVLMAFVHKVVSRLMGLMLAVIGVQMLIVGIRRTMAASPTG